MSSDGARYATVFFSPAWAAAASERTAIATPANRPTARIDFVIVIPPPKTGFAGLMSNGAPPRLAEAVDEDRDENGDAGDRPLPEAVDADEIDAVLDDSDRQSPQHSADSGARAAEQACSADHDRRDGLEHQARPSRGFGVENVGDRQEAGERCQQRRRDIGHEFRPLDRDAKQIGSRRTAADGIEPAACHHLLQEEFDCDQEDHAEEDVIRNAGYQAAAVEEPEVRIADRHRAPVGDDEGERAGDGKGDERYDEGRQTGDRDEEAVDRSEKKSDAEADQACRDAAKPVCHRLRGHHAGQGEDRADGEVDTAGDDDKQDAQRHDDKRRTGLRDIGEVAPGERLRNLRADRKGQQHDGESDRNLRPVDAKEAFPLSDLCCRRLSRRDVCPCPSHAAIPVKVTSFSSLKSSRSITPAHRPSVSKAMMQSQTSSSSAFSVDHQTITVPEAAICLMSW
ncbi:hypothetical protein RHECNPAF_13300125 [Rhizobium etli CNPAF512]|nr:hypothetical protein RHECNPAF_13300125 [Rhizobium etli CNPAF512]